jgi:hypothetical protein
MRAPGILEGAGVALAAAILGTGVMAVATSVLAAPLVLRGTVAVLGLGYLLYLLAPGPRRTGKVTMVLLWAVITAATLALDPPLLLHLVAQLALVSGARAVWIHRGVLPALADLALCAASVAVSVWAADRTGSLFLVIWCVMLVQSAFVLIPRRRSAGSDRSSPSTCGDPRFTRAHRAAEAALRRLSAAG